MKVHGRSNVSEFLGDFIVYRNLVPVDQRLPALADLRDGAGLAIQTIPRKSQLAYARVIVEILQRARRLDVPDTRIERLIFIGDTHLNDGTAFENICMQGGWPGMAFIGADRPEPERVELTATPGGFPLVLANRWSALADFERYCREEGLAIDESTAVVVDLDKTALGARGRNDHVIDQARVQAVENTVSGLLGAEYDPQAFRTAYDTLNQLKYHPFTSDNQDYLAYICLVLGGGLRPLADLLEDVDSGELNSFEAFIQWVETQKAELPQALAAIHAGIYAAVEAGDPTPFKQFRREEYRVTLARMGGLPDDASIDQLLGEEIVITQEVRALALEWKARGALLFGLSDKPDEASIPTPEQARDGWLSIHQAGTHILGGG